VRHRVRNPIKCLPAIQQSDVFKSLMQGAAKSKHAYREPMNQNPKGHQMSWINKLILVHLFSSDDSRFI
jgi:hypothetical protein